MNRIRINTFCCLIFLTLSPLSTVANGAIIRGMVQDYFTNKPLGGVVINIENTQYHKITTGQGLFEFNELTAGDFNLRFSMIGYNDWIESIVTVESDTSSLVIYLKPKSIPFDNITVTATRLDEDSFDVPMSVSITSGEKFSERSYSSTAEIVREESGILVQKTTHGHGAPIIRGLIGRHVLLLYDGIRLNRPTFRFGANQYMNTVDIVSFDKIEIVRGPSSVMYGSDAMGGTVNMIPATRTYDRPGFFISPRVISRYSSADEGKSIHFSLSGGNNQFSVFAGGSYKDIGDLKAGENIGKQCPTGWTEANHSLRLSYNINKNNTVKFDYLAVRQSNVPRYDKYVSGDFETNIYDPQDRDLFAASYSLNRIGAVFNSLKVNVSYQKENEGCIERKTGSNYLTHSRDKVTTWGGLAQISSHPHRNHWLLTGIEYYRDRINSGRVRITDGVSEILRPSYPDNTYYYSIGIFIQDEFQMADKLSLISGLRYSYFKIDSPLDATFGYFRQSYSNLTGMLGLSYHPVTSLNIIGRWSRGFRAPNLNDTVVLKYSSSGVDAPSFDLDPELSNNFEAGIKVRKSNLGGSLFIFYNRLDGLIDRKPGVYDGLTFYDENGNGVQDQDEYDIYQKYNVDDAAIYGFEFEGDININPKWQTRFNCFWTRGDNYSQNEPMSRIPPAMGLASLRFIPYKRIWLEAYIRMAGSQRKLSTRDKDDSRIDPNGTPGWITLNLRTQLSFSYFKFNILFENLIDSSYKEHGSGVYSPGRGIVISLSINPK